MARIETGGGFEGTRRTQRVIGLVRWMRRRCATACQAYFRETMDRFSPLRRIKLIGKKGENFFFLEREVREIWCFWGCGLVVWRPLCKRKVAVSITVISMSRVFFFCFGWVKRSTGPSGIFLCNGNLPDNFTRPWHFQLKTITDSGRPSQGLSIIHHHVPCNPNMSCLFGR